MFQINTALLIIQQLITQPSLYCEAETPNDWPVGKLIGSDPVLSLI